MDTHFPNAAAVAHQNYLQHRLVLTSEKLRLVAPLASSTRAVISCLKSEDSAQLFPGSMWTVQARDALLIAGLGSAENTEERQDLLELIREVLRCAGVPASNAIVLADATTACQALVLAVNIGASKVILVPGGELADEDWATRVRMLFANGSFLRRNIVVEVVSRLGADRVDTFEALEQLSYLDGFEGPSPVDVASRFGPIAVSDYSTDQRCGGLSNGGLKGLFDGVEDRGLKTINVALGDGQLALFGVDADAYKPADKHSARRHELHIRGGSGATLALAATSMEELDFLLDHGFNTQQSWAAFTTEKLIPLDLNELFVDDNDITVYTSSELSPRISFGQVEVSNAVTISGEHLFIIAAAEEDSLSIRRVEIGSVAFVDDYPVAGQPLVVWSKEAWRLTDGLIHPGQPTIVTEEDGRLSVVGVDRDTFLNRLP